MFLHYSEDCACFLLQNSVTILCLSVFQQLNCDSAAPSLIIGFVFCVSGCDTLIGSLFDVLLAYLESPNTGPTVSIELRRDPSLLA